MCLLGLLTLTYFLTYISAKKTLFILILLIPGKPCQIAKPLLIHNTIKQNVGYGFSEEYAPKYFNSIKFKMADLRPLLTLICIISGNAYQKSRL